MCGNEVILLTMGLPGRFAQWCDTVLARVAGEPDREVASRAWPPLGEMISYDAIPPALDELARLLIANNSNHVVIGLRQPDHTLCRILAERNARFVVALDDPRAAAADTLADSGADPRSVVRAIANSCVAVMKCDGLPGALSVHAEYARHDPAAAVSAIAAHFGIAAESGRVETIVNELAGSGGWASNAGEEPAARVPSAIQKTVDGALLPYRKHFLTGRLDEIIWKRDLFFLDTGNSPTGTIDVAGGARVLIFGPYIHLPAGSWTAQIILGFSEEAASHNFLVDVYTDVQLACANFQPGAPGVYSTNLTFTLGEMSGKGVEIRVMVGTDYARGRLAFGQVVLRPLSMRQPDAISGSQAFETVLEL